MGRRLKPALQSIPGGPPEYAGMSSAVVETLARVESQHWWFKARRRILVELVRALIAPGHDKLVVDIGCGTGGNTMALGEHYHCVGIDASPVAIELACRRFPGVHFICGRAPDDLGSLATHARLFLLGDVMEHVYDDCGMLSQLITAAAPGAYFLLTVPADPRLWSPHDVAHGHHRRYTREQFEELWRGQPVSVLLVSHFNRRLLPVIQVVRRINCWRGHAQGTDGTDVRMPFALANWALERIFAGEIGRLRAALNGTAASGYQSGVSLMAVLQRRTGNKEGLPPIHQ